MVRLRVRALAPVTLLALIAACGNAPSSSTASSAMTDGLSFAE